MNKVRFFPNSSNTIENLKDLIKIIDNNENNVVITSAFHMKRAEALFEKKGFSVTAFKVDYKTPPVIKLNIFNILPNAGALSDTETAFRELLGRLYYGLF